MKKLLMVGAGSCQINAIRKMKQMGHTVIALDYNLWTPGKALSDEQILADAFDVDAVLACARSHQVDGILTVGTDQPVYVVNVVAEKLDLPHFIDSDTALWVTNKKEMKRRFNRFKIPTAPFAVVRKSFSSAALMGIMPPYVIKPIDSQGQRGIYKVDSIDEIRMRFDDVVKYSRTDEILIEQFYESEEVTVSGWVNGGKLSIYTVTDRVTFSPDYRIGVCIAHRYPTKHQSAYGARIQSLTEEVVNRFNIEAGPIYFQYLIGDKGIWVNEIACRLGGAYEDVTIPYVTDIDVLEHNIIGSYTPKYKFSASANHHADRCFSTQLFFCRPGTIVSMTPLEKLREKSYILDAGFNFRMGDQIGQLENASQRAGYFIVTGETPDEVEERIKNVYDFMTFQDAHGNNLIIPYHEALSIS